jgi:quinol monooxygenase YgiN
VVTVSEPIVSIDVSEVREGKIEELKTLMKELVEFVEANEPRPIAYQMFLDQNGTMMTVVQVHPDSESMEFHIDVAASLFRRFPDLLTLLRIDIYGKPSAELVRQLRKKGRMLGGAPVVAHQLQAGFVRFEPGNQGRDQAP